MGKNEWKRYEEGTTAIDSVIPDLSDKTPSVGEFGSGIVAEGEPVKKERKSQETMEKELNDAQRIHGGLMVRLAALEGVRM